MFLTERNLSVKEYECLDSTILEIKRHIDRSDYDIVKEIVVTKEQNAGYGRNNRSWISATGNLYMSFCLQNVSVSEVNMLAVIIALSVRSSICNSKCTIKWPNDIMIDQKKVSGMIIESYKEIMIIGIGVNIESKPELNTATCTKEHDVTIDRLSLAKKIVSTMYDYIVLLDNGEKNTILTEYRSHMAMLGTKVVISTKQNKFVGTASAISDNGELILKKLDNTELLINAGDLYIIEN
ncbi:biotin--[acetyl-CoA-carboxylase] ligase [Anaplasmataceae bacterium AB001_6]|nr:biotin--[acetyl-CoA-carboxylase] ligase [Anaplasmataceae bacterium AB001_6]